MILGCVSGSRRRLARGCIGAGLALAAMLAALPRLTRRTIRRAR